MDTAVKQLLSLKAEYKQATGQDYKPGVAPAVSPAPVQASPAPQDQSGSSPQALFTQVVQKGELVRKLKSEKAPKVSGILFHFANLWPKMLKTCYLLTIINQICLNVVI